MLYKFLLALALIVPLSASSGPTAGARATLSAATATLTTQFDAIDAAAVTPPPSGSVPIPASGDRLAGTNPGWADGNMFADELAETYWHDKRTLYKKRMATAPSGAVLLLGDSMLEYQSALNVPHSVNFGIAGESSRQLLYRINDLDIKGQPNLIHRAGAVVLHSFVNDFADSRNGSTPQLRADTAMIIARKIINLTTGPLVIHCPTKLSTTVFPVEGPATNAAIDAFWTAMTTEFGSNSRIALVNINPTVAPSGSLLPAYHIDGQHGNFDWGVVWSSATRAALQTLGVYP